MGKLLLPGLLVGFGLGIALVSIIVGFVVVPNMIEGQIEKNSQLKEGSDTWDDWETNPIPVYIKFYLFHVNDPLAIEKREKPSLTERGPYVFSQIRKKHVSDVNVDEDTVTYRQSIQYFYEEDLSVDESGTQLSLDDKINIINVPFIAVSTGIFSMNLGDIGKAIFKKYKDDGESFVKQNVSVREALFEGWKYSEVMRPLVGDKDQFAGGRFGLYRGKNGSNDGEFVINSGYKDSANYGKILKWEGLPALTWWDNPSNESLQLSDPKYCNMINGTDGSVFPPFLKEDSPVGLFSTDVCRSVLAEFKGEDSHRDIKGYKFGFPESFYSHPKENNDNYCFCPSPENPGLENSCARGIIRLASCNDGAPLVTSSPHFYNGDQEMINKLIGMKPEEELHETYLLIQPDAGVPLKIRKRIQISLEVQSFSNMFDEFFNDIDYTVFPAVWASEETELDEVKTEELKSKLLTPVKIVDIVKWVVLAIGIVLAAGGIFVFFKRRRS